MSNRFYPGQADYITALNSMDDDVQLAITKGDGAAEAAIEADEARDEAVASAAAAAGHASSADADATATAADRAATLGFRNEAETFKNSASGSATAASTSAGTASGHATTATTKAGEASASASLAQSWASSTSIVSGGYYGAYKYAVDAKAEADRAQGYADQMFAGQVNADWNAVSGVAAILNKPWIPRLYNVADNAGVAGWVRLGIWTAGQSGQMLRLRVVAHAGYNASNTQSQESILVLKTGNNSSVDANGFAGDGYWYSQSVGSVNAPSAFKVVANNAGTGATTFTVYANMAAYSLNTFYSVETGTGAGWTNSPAAAQADPGAASATVLIPERAVYGINGNSVITAAGGAITGNLTFNATAAERQIRFEDTGTGPAAAGFYMRPDNVFGAYDWTNTRAIWTYTPSTNRVDFGTSTVGVASLAVSASIAVTGNVDMTGTVNTRNPTPQAGITSVVGAPVTVPDTNVASGAASFSPALHQRTTITGAGFRQHLAIGAYRTGASSYAGGIFFGLGNTDANPTEYFLMNQGGELTHSSGKTFLHSGNYGTYALSASAPNVIKASGTQASYLLTSGVMQAEMYFRDNDKHLGLYVNDGTNAATRIRIVGPTGDVRIIENANGAVIIGASANDGSSNKLQVTGPIKATGTLSAHVGDAVRIIESKNSSASLATQFYIDHSNEQVVMGNARGAMSIIKPTIKGFIEQMQTLNPGATVTVDPLGLGTLIEITTTANLVITLPAPVAGMSFTIIIKFGGAHTVTFATTSGTLTWTGAGNAGANAAPQATMIAGRMDVYTFISGSNYIIGRDGGRGA